MRAEKGGRFEHSFMKSHAGWRVGGSPFSDINYTADLQILPKEQIEQVIPQSFVTKPQNIYINDQVEAPQLATQLGATSVILARSMSYGIVKLPKGVNVMTFKM